MAGQGGWRFDFRFRDFGIGKDGGELKINQTKPPVGKAVGDVARVGVVMAHAEFFQLGEQPLGALIVNVLDAGAAVAGDDAQVFFVRFEQAGDEIAAARGEVPQHAHLILEPFVRVRGRGRP